MQSILYDLYCGNVKPMERFVPQTTEEKLACMNLERCRRELGDILGVNAKLFDQYQEFVEQLEAIYEVEAFLSGFKLAACILAEALAGAPVGPNQQPDSCPEG